MQDARQAVASPFWGLGGAVAAMEDGGGVGAGGGGAGHPLFSIPHSASRRGGAPDFNPLGCPPQ
jgi:hypothetical protein